MVKFKAVIERFDKNKDKTGWTYIIVKAQYANRLSPGTKCSFRVKGRLDSYGYEGLALLPIGKGDFMLALNATIRKNIRKSKGETLEIEMNLDDRLRVLSRDMVKCLKQEPPAYKYFKTLPLSHQHYFSKWIEDAKTVHTKTKRIVMAVAALALGQGYGEMIRANKTTREER